MARPVFDNLPNTSDCVIWNYKTIVFRANLFIS